MPTSPSKQEIERIARGLSGAEREALLGGPNDDMPSEVALSFMSPHQRIFRPISLDPPEMAWTDIGLAIRAPQQEQGE